jgi:predicted TIM-barrel fold metal-dependent hydrolase
MTSSAVRFQEEADIEAEVMNPTRLLGIMRNPDAEVVQACAQVYNDWEAGFASYSPKRLIGVSVIPMHDVAWALEELERTLEKGLLNPMINCQAPEGCPPYRDPVYDRFWAAASEAGAPVTLHLLTGRVLSPLAALRTKRLRSATTIRRNGSPCSTRYKPCWLMTSSLAASWSAFPN